MSAAASRVEMPPARRGQAIGLLGGSFDPPHAGHVHLTREALKRFGLDAVWWLVSPGNPLKADGPAPLARRMAASREIMQHPRVHVSDIEVRIGTRRTACTLAALRAMRPDLHFVWLMGADNMTQLHKWHEWRRIMRTVPVGVLARPGARLEARASVAARVYEHARVPVERARAEPDAGACVVLCQHADDGAVLERVARCGGVARGCENVSGPRPDRDCRRRRAGIKVCA